MEKYIPAIGERVYCIYRKECILSNGVYALSGHSFIVEGFRRKNEDAWEYRFEDYNKTWFTDLKRAKACIMSFYDKEKYKLVPLGNDCFDIRFKEQP